MKKLDNFIIKDKFNFNINWILEEAEYKLIRRKEFAKGYLGAVVKLTKVTFKNETKYYHFDVLGGDL